jgi:hypothetical protein
MTALGQIESLRRATVFWPAAQIATNDSARLIVRDPALPGGSNPACFAGVADPIRSLAIAVGPIASDVLQI